jgi:hypothetical protein
MRDAVALTVAAIWFALNIGLWAMPLSRLALFGVSVALGTMFFAGFFLYLGHNDRQRVRRTGA